MKEFCSHKTTPLSLLSTIFLIFGLSPRDLERNFLDRFTILNETVYTINYPVLLDHLKELDYSKVIEEFGMTRSEQIKTLKTRFKVYCGEKLLEE